MPLIDHRARGEAGDVKGVSFPHWGVANAALGQLADYIQFALECKIVVARQPLRVAPDENLAHDRLSESGRMAQRLVRCRHRAPAQNRLTFRADNLFKALLAQIALVHPLRQKDHPHRVLLYLRQFDPFGRGDLTHKFVRHLHEDTGAVTGVRLTSARAAVRQIEEYLQSLRNNRARLLTLYVHDETDATGIVFVARVIEALLGPAIRDGNGKQNDQNRGGSDDLQT